jgi:hypothetical protein
VSINQFNLKSNSSTEIADGFIAVVFHCWLKETKALHLLMPYLPTEGNGLILFISQVYCGDRKLQFVLNYTVTCHLQVVVATIAFGMGIDKLNVRRIIHYGWPQVIS